MNLLRDMSFLLQMFAREKCIAPELPRSGEIDLAKITLTARFDLIEARHLK
jgi:hypothetical protein